MYANEYEIMLAQRQLENDWMKHGHIYRALLEQSRLRRRRRLMKIAGVAVSLCLHAGAVLTGTGERLERKYRTKADTA